METPKEETKDFEKFLASLEKKYGPETLSIPKVDIIPSTSMGLNILTRVGGIPLGRITEMYGPESGGKCLSKDTYILTPQGYKTLEEIFLESEITPDLGLVNSKVNYPLINRYGDTESTLVFTKNGKRPLTLLRTRTGTGIKSTSNHPHLVLSKRGNLIWKRTNQIQQGDYLATFRKPVFGSKSQNLDEMYGLGLLVADGCFQKSGVGITNNDAQIKEFIEQKFCKIFPFSSWRKSRNKSQNEQSFCYDFQAKCHKKFYQDYNLTPGIAKDKKIPLIVRQSNREAVRAFIQGYLDCESYIASEGSLEVASASYKLLEGLKMLLLQFGIVSYLKKIFVNTYPDTDYWALYLSGADLELWATEIGTNNLYRQNQLAPWMSQRSVTKHTSAADSIPYLQGTLRDIYNSFETSSEINSIFYDYMREDHPINLTYPQLKRVLGVIPNSPLQQHLQDLSDLHYFFDRVDSVEAIGNDPTFDFTMLKTHSFIANGIVTHNTTIALDIIANANRLGKRCFFIDVEAALDKSWAKRIGVDWNLTTYIRPPSGEKVFDILVELTKSNFYSLGVVDSVAALVSETELSKDLGDTKDRVAGFTAKIMSSGLRKITPLLATHNVGVIFINQVRDNIGVLYGDKESTPGGRALKFYASIRIRVNKFTAKDKVFKQGDIQIGHRCSIKLKKNKLGAPDSRDAEFNLYYDSGIDQENEIIEWAHTLGILHKRGESLTYLEKKFTVKDFTDLLKQDKDFRGELSDLLYKNSRKTGEVEEDPLDSGLSEGLI